MCDYSLERVNSRPAKIGEDLISKRFDNSSTTGFTSTTEEDVAVCLLPGTELKFDADVKYRASFTFLPARKIRSNVARFRQINTHDRHVHHDALEFPDGRIVLLTHLCQGQRATVLQLPAGMGAGHHHDHHDHYEHHSHAPAPADIAARDRKVVTV